LTGHYGLKDGLSGLCFDSGNRGSKTQENKEEPISYRHIAQSILLDLRPLQGLTLEMRKLSVPVFVTKMTNKLSTLQNWS
jgi:hypothetical protein